MPRSSYAVSRPVAPRKWLALFALLSFFLQSLAVQTHIHQQFPLAGGNAVTHGVPIPAPVKNQDPMDQCRLCQELVHAGHFVEPSAAASLASLSFVAAIFAAQATRLDQPVAGFSWNSRAPPRR